MTRGVFNIPASSGPKRTTSTENDGAEANLTPYKLTDSL